MEAKKLQQAVVLIFFLFCGVLFAKSSETFQYLSPVPGSDLNSRQTNIIIREGNKIDPSNLSNPSLIQIIGSQSGIHTGELLLSDDEKTIVFNPHSPFEPNETVTVTLHLGLKTIEGKEVKSTSFSFKITPLSQPLKYKNLESENTIPIKPHLSKSASKSAVSRSTNNDSLPNDFPELAITHTGETAPGYLFGGSNSSVDSIGNYFMILENSGNPLFYSQEVSAGRLLPTGYFASARPLGPKHQYIWYIKDRTFSVVDSFQMGNGYIADNHDFLLLPNGHAIMLAYDIQIIDMSKIIEGGRPDAQVTGSIIQELDVERNVVYQWRCWDHIPITDSYKDITKPRFDYIHVNSVELDNDGHIILSCRETSEILKISRETGETIWRMGGKNNDFTILGDHEENAPRYFKLQHSVRRMPDGNIIMFDNGADKDNPQRTYSRAVEYAMDEENKTATMVWEFRHDPDILALTGGTVVRLSNGNTSINWGGASREGAPGYTEANSAGELVYEISFADPNVNGNFSRYLWFDLDPIKIVTHYEVMEGNTYDFSEGDSIDTGISIKINSYTGESYNEMTVKRESYGPLYPEFIQRAPVVFSARVTISAADIMSINADVMFDLEKFDFSDPDSLVIFHREFPGQGLFIPLATDYNRVTKTLRATITKFGELIVGKPDFKSVAYAPILLSPADSEKVNYTLGANLLWTPVGYVNEYRIQISNDESFANLILDKQLLSVTSFKMDTLENNSTYYWRVLSINDAGESDWSKTQMFTTTAPFVSVLVPNGGEEWQLGLRYFIQWDDNLSEDVVIELHRGESLIETISITSSSGAYRWEIDTGLEPGLNYLIKVKSTVDDTLFDISDNTFSIIDTTGASVSDRGEVINDYSLYQNYPNPFNPVTQIHFDLAKDEFVTLKIYDVRGYEVITLFKGYKRAGAHTVSCSASQLSSGLYLYKLETPSFSHTRKMIVMK